METKGQLIDYPRLDDIIKSFPELIDVSVPEDYYNSNLLNSNLISFAKIKKESSYNQIITTPYCGDYDSNISILHQFPENQYKNVTPSYDSLLKQLSVNPAPKYTLPSTNKIHLNFNSDTWGWVDIEDLPELVRPIVDFIDMVQPHVVVAADRGGRLLGLAAFKQWHEQNPDQPFPTVDGRVHFARISKALNDDELTATTRDTLERTARLARGGRGVPEGEPLRVLLLDDWVSSGLTRDSFKAALSRLGFEDGKTPLQLFTGVMCGRKADVSGDESRTKDCSWHDNADMIGVAYDRAVPIPLRTTEAQQARIRLEKAVKTGRASLSFATV